MFRAHLLSLFNQFLQTGGDTAVVETRGYRRQKLTYGELYGYVLFWSHALARRGIGPGDWVLLWGPNSSEWVSRFWAILLRGAVVVPMDTGASLEFVQRVVHESQVKLILHDGTQPEIPGHHPDRRPNHLPAKHPSRRNPAPLQFLVQSL
jgi:long-chain acyl-CoA synthetase